MPRPVPNYPHLVIADEAPSRALDRAPASPGALAAVMAAIENDDAEELERLANQYAQSQPRTLSLSRGVSPGPTNPEYDRRPDVMAARLAQLGGGRTSRPGSSPARQLAKGAVFRWPGHLSRNSPAARAMIASLVKAGATVVCDDGFRAGPEDAPTAPAAASPRIDASAAPGRNPTEKAINAMRERVAGFAQLSWDQQFEKAAVAMSLGVVTA
jgi:hypothetical protein